MKTKIILIAVITIIGISLFSAFKQSEGSKKYLIMQVSSTDLTIIDEKGLVVEKKIASQIYNLKGTVDLAKEINSISSKGYKLVSIQNYNIHFQYYFEKE